MVTKMVKPKDIITGENAVKRSMKYIRRMGKKCLIVTDDSMIKLGNTERLIQELEKIEINYVVYSKINSEPTHQMIDEGVDLYKKRGCDFLIALGGGSPEGVNVAEGLKQRALAFHNRHAGFWADIPQAECPGRRRRRRGSGTWSPPRRP